jgi:hypothetical protein
LYGLTRVFAGVGNNAEAVGEIERNSELCRDLKYVRHNGAVALINIERGGDVLLGNYENMHGSLGLKVIKCDYTLILIDLV